MCGLAGWIRFRPIEDKPAIALGETLRNTIAKRGPDGHGFWRGEDNRVGLVHTRLAVIDPTERSDQPLIDRETNAVIIYNGEIYNYRALRSELEDAGVEFETSGDTEVILKGYLTCGLTFFERLRGMYAFAIYDGRYRQLLVLRDPLSIKPLYVRQMDDGVFFGSSARGLSVVEHACDPNPSAAVSLVTFGCVLEPMTSFKTIEMIAPGVAHIWRMYDRMIEVRKAGVEPAIPVTAGREPASAAHFRNAIEESVQAHFEADVEVAVFQSAGLDSSAISTLAASRGLRPVLVTLGFEDFRGGDLDEAPGASMVGERLGLRHEAIYLSKSDFSDLREKFLDDIESPTIDGINTYLVAMICRRLGLKVALSGVGADELFGGYPSAKTLPRIYRLRSLLMAPGLRNCGDFALRMLARRADQSPKLAYLTSYLDSFARLYLFGRAIHMPEQAESVLDPDVLRAGLPGCLEAFAALAGSSSDGDTAAVLKLERNVYLRNMLLRDADWAGMAHGVEIRTPFVDLAFQRAVCDASDQCSYTKADLQQLIVGVDPGYGSVRRRKTGFSVPYKAWFDPDISEHQRLPHSARGIQNWCREIAKVTFPGWTNERVYSGALARSR